MKTEELDPEYVDKGDIDPEKLVEIYSDFGLQMDYDQRPERKISQLREQFGDVRNEILYLESIDAVDYTEDMKVKLKPSERKIAGRLSQRIFWDEDIPSKILSSGELPFYLEEPGMTEDYNEPIDAFDQQINDELYTRIIETLADEETLTPEELEENLAVDINFDLEPKLQIMEQKGAAARDEDGRYRLVSDNIDRRLFGEQMDDGTLKERQRHGNDPWKP